MKIVCVCISIHTYTYKRKRARIKYALKRYLWELPWQSNGSDSILPMQGAWVQSLVRELSFIRHTAQAKKILVYSVENAKNYPYNSSKRWKEPVHCFTYAFFLRYKHEYQINSSEMKVLG